MALAVVGIALGQVALGHTMVGENEFVRTTMCLPVSFDTLRHRLNVAWGIVIGTDKPQRW